MSNEASEATPAVAMDPAATAAASLTPQRASLQHLQQQLKDVAVFANAITYLLYITAPLHFAMVTIGKPGRHILLGGVMLSHFR